MSDNPQYDKSQIKALAMKKIEKLSGDSEWHLLQQVAQDIEAMYKLKEEKLSLEKHVTFLEDEVKARYSDQPDLLQALLDGIPSKVTMATWKKKKGWDEAVWMKIRGEGLFTPDNRAKVIQKLFSEAAIEGNVPAAKIWLTLSGDYVEKGDSASKDSALDMFRSLNEAIHSKK